MRPESRESSFNRLRRASVSTIHVIDEGVVKCSVDFRVRYAECDAFGYLHHARYWEYFEQARTELLRLRGIRYRDLEAQGVFFVVYKGECRYLRPIRYDDLVTVTVDIRRTTHTRVDHGYEVRCENQVTCVASTTLACVDRHGRPQVMPPLLWSEHAPFVASSGGE